VREREGKEEEEGGAVISRKVVLNNW